MSTPLQSGPLNALYDVIDFVGQLKDPEEDKVWTRLCEKLSVAIGAEAATYYVFLPQKLQIVPRYALGVAAEDLKGTPVDIRTGLSGWVALHKEPLLVPDAYHDSRFLREVDKVTGFRTRSVLAVPLLDRLEMTGVLQFLNKTGEGPFPPEDLELVLAATRVTSLALRAAKLESTVDKVTARNASILENLGGGFLAIDMHGRVILCNPAAKRILQLPNDAKLNVAIDVFLVGLPRLADVLMDTLAKRETAKRQELSWSHQGQDRTIGYSTILIQDPRGELTGAGISFQDITGFKR